ncbi:b(o/a)3-type cytochrome-c oxidase subunit 1 [Natronobacterium gregoryi]|uniref:Cytochrome C oxidase subunit I n=2 Tax=Natronobacterium gregoryi TaxID=44930 RepID=L0AGI4_NATGS|nr:b(o/a)3-type cytochrome-c oxidase subunit 1 [Natronobacterium gregoryi]AFZ73018.1 heme/copper-type cytochrome/quinol oxidase, subunit 1 [Natronobacterium gregoryi SP2]ELY64873.1 cytochrome c oxidase subunit I [Natronobacterium gregoryi SP2]PLK18378.1 cytochrome C oxidase subunit I [Natronobacterium gregoryi SP2]SFJ71621.1 cytochrome c oxidase subunit 1 [Natronobacterium gregoryi]
MSTYVDNFPEEAAIVRKAFYTSFVFLALGGVFGLIQTLHRTDFLRFMDSADYYTVLTAHGVFLVIAFTIFFLVGVFTWAVTTSLDRGLEDLRLTKLWFGLMSAGGLAAAITILSGFVGDAPILGALDADVLFTFYTPLEAHPLFYIGLVVFVIGTWVAGADWIRTWWSWRKDNPNERIPLPTFMVITTMIMWYIATLGVAIAIIVFILPWSLGLVESVNPLLTRTLFWYFGHPVVYFWLMPAYMMWYLLLPKLAGGRLFSDPLARVVFVLFLLLSTPVGIHHQYLDPGISEGFKFIAMTNTMFLLLPSFLTAFTVVASMEHGARQNGGTGYLSWLGALPWRDPAFTGMALAGLMFAAGGFSGMVNAGMNINYLVHNSLWVPGHFHLTVGTAVALTFMAGAYWFLPQLTGNKLWSRPLAVGQTVIWFIGMSFMSNAMHRAGLIGMPRRTAEPQYENFGFDAGVGSVAELDAQIALGGALLTVSLLLFFVVIAMTAFNGDSDYTESNSIPTPLSGPEDAPQVLDNLKLWTILAIVLVIIAYSLPLASIIDGRGLFGPGIEPFDPIPFSVVSTTLELTAEHVTGVIR